MSLPVNDLPSYAQGFAEHPEDSMAPGLWRGLIGGWAPSLGRVGGINTGAGRIRDLSGFRNHALVGSTMSWAHIGRGGGWTTEHDDSGAANRWRVGTLGRYATNAMSVACRFLVTSLAANSLVVSKVQGANQQVSWKVLTDGSVQFHHNNGISGANASWSAASIVTNTWHDVVSTWRSGGPIRAYSDGVELGAPSANFNGPLMNATGHFLVGDMVGNVSYVFMWNRELRPVEVVQFTERPLALFTLAPRILRRPVITPRAMTAVSRKRSRVDVTTQADPLPPQDWSRVVAGLWAAGSVAVQAAQATPGRAQSWAFDPEPIHHREYQTLRGAYRVFNPALYRFYRSNSGPPLESDTPFATNATLPHTPANTYADGTWWVSVSYFNGVLDSGFLPIGTNGETFIRLDITSGTLVTAPPLGAVAFELIQQAGGVVNVLGSYVEPAGSTRAQTFAIWYTTDGSPPASPPTAPTTTVPMVSATRGIMVLDANLPLATHGPTIKVRVGTHRTSDDTYSASGTVKTIVVDSVGPTASVDNNLLTSGGG